MASIIELLSNEKWPAENPDIIQLYSLATPNGQKIGIALEEMEISYEPHLIHIGQGDQSTDFFRQVNPNGKIPAIIDPDGPGGKPQAIMESAAILVHLANKSGKFMPSDPGEASEALQWLFFQVGHIGPMFGQFGHFWKFARETCDHPYPLERYTNETRRLLQVLEDRLANRDYLLGDDYSVVDMATMPWVRCLGGFYDAAEHLGLGDFAKVDSWQERCLKRPATQRGIEVCSLG